LALRRTLLIAPLLLALAGWAGARPGPAATRDCGGCHAPHFTEAGTCASCHRGDPKALRKEIAHHRLLTGRAAAYARPDDPAVVEGRQLVERLACRRCHVVGGSGNRLATALDRVVWRREQRELQRSVSSPVENMPRFGVGKGQMEAIVACLLHGADSNQAEAIYRVRFSKNGARPDSVFEERCGGCHRALTAAGPLGRGSAGPNLSGLLSPHYPRTAEGGEPWSGRHLERWLENPRSRRTLAAMRPVRLRADDQQRLGDELR
jgi:cytochrome c2